MKILVTVKRVIDPYIKVRVRADGKGVETANIKMAMNPFCENALEEAIRWREAGVASEVVAVSLGDASFADTLRAALAKGADRAILVKTETPPAPLKAARMIAEVAKQESPEVIWMGKQAIDGDYNQTGQMVAQLLGWGAGLFLSEASYADGVVTAQSEVDTGIKTLNIKTPCVLSADLRLNEPRYATLPNIMKAKKKPLEEVTLAELDAATDGIEIVDVFDPPARASGRRVADVDELVKVLREEAKVLK